MMHDLALMTRNRTPLRKVDKSFSLRFPMLTAGENSSDNSASAWSLVKSFRKADDVERPQKVFAEASQLFDVNSRVEFNEAPRLPPNPTRTEASKAPRCCFIRE